MSSQGNFDVLSKAAAKSIQRIRQVAYVVDGRITSETGPVEIALEDGSMLLFDAAPDGEGLVVEASAWNDHFAEPLSADNREYVKRFGKWTAFDVSGRLPYSRAIGQLVDGISAIRTPQDKLKGAVIKAGACAIRIEIEADEVFMEIA